jgi:hypothetical protein
LASVTKVSGAAKAAVAVPNARTAARDNGACSFMVKLLFIRLALLLGK